MLLAAAALLVVTANPYLDEGRARFKALEFEAAARGLEVAMNEPRLSVGERREGHDLWAQSLLALGRMEDAVSVYARLLKEDPHAPPPQAAPKVVDAFVRARQATWPPPSVALTVEPSAAGPSVAVRVTDPWSLVKRLRRMEDGPTGLAERPAVPVVDHRVSVVPTPGSTRLLLDALDSAGALLAHLEVPVTAEPAPPAAVERPVTVAEAPPSSPRPRWVPVLLGAAAVIAAGVGALFLGFAFRTAPTLDPATEINAWNDAALRNAAAGWSLGGVAVVLAAAALFVAAR